MNISVNGQSQVLPGFRFHPTEEELLQYYLRKKISHKKIDLDVIHDLDLNKLEPWDIQERCKIGATAQTDWYFFSHKDKKYPIGTRTNRATAAGFWKATGRDKVIYSTNSSRNIIGMRKTLVFYTGRAPTGLKSDWIMYEYRLDDHGDPHSHVMFGEEEGWVVCCIFKKRNNQQKCESKERSKLMPNHEKEEKNYIVKSNMIMSFGTLMDCFDDEVSESGGGSSSNIVKWATVDQFVACQLNGQTHDRAPATNSTSTLFQF